MRMLGIFFLFVSGIVCSSGNPDNTNKKINAPSKIKEIPLPPGFERVNVQASSFEEYLQNIQLKQSKTVYLYNGQKKYNQSAQYAVLNISVGQKNLQQCADAVMRLRSEYLKLYNKPVCFKDNNGKSYCWSNYSNRGWQTYLDIVFGMCGTLSLEKELKKKSWSRVTAGNVLIKGGYPGHAVIIVDVARNPKSGKTIFLLAQSYMPAQDIHILKNLVDQSISPWYTVPENNPIQTPEWTFYENQLRGW
ncbi:MAG: DUF4846 domain-containing protein [Lacibacter sp.]